MYVHSSKLLHKILLLTYPIHIVRVQKGFASKATSIFPKDKRASSNLQNSPLLSGNGTIFRQIFYSREKQQIFLTPPFSS